MDQFVFHMKFGPHCPKPSDIARSSRRGGYRSWLGVLTFGSSPSPARSLRSSFRSPVQLADRKNGGAVPQQLPRETSGWRAAAEIVCSSSSRNLVQKKYLFVTSRSWRSITPPTWCASGTAV